jgi:hypothetical protein
MILNVESFVSEEYANSWWQVLLGKWHEFAQSGNFTVASYEPVTLSDQGERYEISVVAY